MADEEQPPKGKGRGGWRPGAGRKVGSEQIKTRRIGNQLAKRECTPLHILVGTMTAFWEQAQRTVEKQPKLALMREACGVAEKAAPYIHARLSSVNATIRKVTSLKDLSDDELLALATVGRQRAVRSARGRPRPRSLTGAMRKTHVRHLPHLPPPLRGTQSPGTH